MKVTKVSQYTGKTHTMDLNITEKEIEMYNWNPNLLLQDAFPNLTDSEREFIKSGIIDSEWDELFPPEEEEGE